MIIITSQKFEDLYNTTNPPDYLFGAIGDQVKFTVEFKVVAEMVDKVLEVNGSLNTIRRAEGSFIADGFNFGDMIRLEVVGSPGDFRELKIIGITDTILTVDDDPGTGDDTHYHIHLLTEIAAVDLLFNLVPNSSNSLDFRSYLDSSERKYSAPVPAVSSLALMAPNQSSKAWQHGFVLLTRLTNDGYHQRFKLEHTFLITPFFLEGGLSDASQLLVPDYFADTESLKYIYEIRGRYGVTDPDIKHTTDSEYSNAQFFLKPGNVGWFDEHLNANLPTYVLSSPTQYFESGTANALTALSKNTDTDVKILIEAQQGSELRSATPYTKAMVQIFRLPTESQYSNPTQIELTNFLYDRVIVNSDNVALSTDGEFLGAIKVGAKAQVIDAGTKLEITFTVLAGFYPVGTPYCIFVTCHDNTATEATLSDRTAVIADIQSAGAIFDTGGPFTAQTKFYWALSSFEAVEGQTHFDNIKSYVGDGLYINSLLAVIKDSEKEAYLLKKVTVLLQAEKSGFTVPYTLLNDSFEISPGESEILVSRGKNYKTSEPLKKSVKIIRREDLDSDTQIFYELQYGQKIRWEEWRSLVGQQPGELNSLSGGQLETFGKHNWSQYNKKSWVPKWKVISETEVTDLETLETSTIRKVINSDVTIRNFDNKGIISENTGSTLIGCVIDTYDAEGYEYCLDNALPVSLASLKKMINAPGRNTRVVATFTPENSNNFAGKTISAMWAAIRLDAPGVGGENFVWEIDSLSFVLPDIPLKALDDTGLIRKQLLTGPKVVAECVIDSSLLPRELLNYQLQARLGEITAAEPLTLSVSTLIRTVEGGQDYKGQISVIAAGGFTPYSYSLDNITYQSSPVLEPADDKVYEVFVKDAANDVNSVNTYVGTKHFVFNSVQLQHVGIAYHPGQDKFYCAPFTSTNSFQVAVVDPTAKTTGLVGTVMSSGFGSQFLGIAYAPNTQKMYCAPHNHGQVLVFDPVANTSAYFGTTLPGSGIYAGIAYCPQNGKLYCAPYNGDPGGEQVLEINPVAGTRVKIGSVYTGTTKWVGIAWHPGTQRFYCAPYSAGQVLKIDPATGTTALFGAVFSGANKWAGIAYSSVNGKLYCAPRNASQVLEIDPITDTCTLIGGVISGTDSYYDICEAGNGRLYCASSQKFSVLEIDPSTTPARVLSFPITQSLSLGIALQTTTGKLYTSGFLKNAVEIF